MIKLTQLLEDMGGNLDKVKTDPLVQKNREAAARDRILIAKRAVTRATSPAERKRKQYRVQKADDRLRKIHTHQPTKPKIERPKSGVSHPKKPHMY